MLDLVPRASATLERLLASGSVWAVLPALDHAEEVVQVAKCFRASWPYLINMSGRWTKGSCCYKTHT